MEEEHSGRVQLCLEYPHPSAIPARLQDGNPAMQPHRPSTREQELGGQRGTREQEQEREDSEDTHILAGGLEQAAGAEEPAAHGVPVVQEQQQDEDCHDEDGGGHGCQETGEAESRRFDEPAGLPLLPLSPRGCHLEKPPRSDPTCCPSRER